MRYHLTPAIVVIIKETDIKYWWHVLYGETQTSPMAARYSNFGKGLPVL